jgi:hypothetical protein
MNVSEFLAQKYHDRAERSAAAADEPEFVLTEREFDYRMRKAFAERERSVRKMFDEREQKIADMLAEHMREVEQKMEEIDRKIATFNMAALDDGIGEAIAAARVQTERILTAKIEQLDLRVSGLLSDLTKRQAVADHSVVDLPNVPERKRA